MASDLISRTALENDLGKVWGIPADWDGGIDEKCETAFTVIGNQPTVDAVEVVHGEWIPEDVDYGGRTEKFKCSACGRVHFYGHYVRCLEYEFCPMCGAKMDGK